MERETKRERQRDAMKVRQRPRWIIASMQSTPQGYNTRNTLQHTATRYNTLQHTATHCNTLQHTGSLKI